MNAKPTKETAQGISLIAKKRSQRLSMLNKPLCDAEEGRLAKIGNVDYERSCDQRHEGSDILSMSGHEEKVLFHNMGGGRFVEIAGGLGLAFSSDGRGLAAADLDGVGAVDLVAGGAYKPGLLAFRNEVGAERGMLTVRLRSPGSKNRFAIGARVVCETETSMRAQEMECGGSFLSCNPAELYFGLGEAKAAKQLTVTWPTGKTTVFATVPAGIVTLTEGEESWKHEPYRKRALAIETKRVRPLRRGDAVTVSFKSLDGAVLDAASFKDKWTVLEVWSASCGSCLLEVGRYPFLAEAAEKRGVRFLAVSLDEDTAKVNDAVSDVTPKLTVWRTDDARNLLVNPREPLVPATILVGPDGKVATRLTGALNQREFESFLEASVRR